jgi:D-3-phosphoglycerate dehydrogenase
MKAFLSAKLTPDGVEKLQERLEIKTGGWGYEGRKLEPEELIEQARDCEIIIICYEEINDFVLDGLPALKLIACSRGGAENIDRGALNRHPDVMASNAPGRNANAVAEFTMGLIISSARHLAKTHHYIMNRDWEHVPWDVKGRAAKKTFEGFELDGKIIGLVGLGAIGQKVAEFAGAFGMTVVAYDPYIRNKENFPRIKFLPLESLLEQSDVVSLHVKVTDETVGMANKDFFARMKRNAIFVNTARGILVNEDHLCDALKQGFFSCAALDVQINEPMSHDSPLLNLDNVILTPHLGGATSDILWQQTKLVLMDVLGYLATGTPIHVIR